MDELARLLSAIGYDFVSLDPSGPVEIVASKSMGPCRVALGLVLQPLPQQFSTLLAYAFGQLGHDALIIVAADPATLEGLVPLLRDQVPAEWAGKVGLVTAPALHLVFPKNP
jgi:hypothetical protein